MTQNEWILLAGVALTAAIKTLRYGTDAQRQKVADYCESILDERQPEMKKPARGGP